MNVAVTWVIFAQTPPFLVLPLCATLAVSLFLCTFTKLGKVTTSFSVFARFSTWNISAPTGWILLKFDICGFLSNFKKIQILLKYHNNNEYFT